MAYDPVGLVSPIVDDRQTLHRILQLSEETQRVLADAGISQHHLEAGEGNGPFDKVDRHGVKRESEDDEERRDQQLQMEIKREARRLAVAVSASLPQSGRTVVVRQTEVRTLDTLRGP